MTSPILNRRISFAASIIIDRANPNGDPLSGNSPRLTNEGRGFISRDCLARKFRDRMVDILKKEVFGQADDRKTDEAKSLKERLEKYIDLKDSDKRKEEIIKEACAKWVDMRIFGALLAYSKGANSSSVSIGLRGPLSLTEALDIAPSTQIEAIQGSRSANPNSTEGGKKGSDTMGMHYVVNHAIYTFYGEFNHLLAEKTEMSIDDVLFFKRIIPKLFENDHSTARPAGSMAIKEWVWWDHVDGAKCSAASLKGTYVVDGDGKFAFPGDRDIKEFGLKREGPNPGF